jgi:outer membrane protein
MREPVMAAAVVLWMAAGASATRVGVPVAAPFATPAPVDTIRLTLNEAVARALATSEEVETARTRRDLAETQITQARAGAYPQITAGLVYNRTLASIFDDIQFDTGAGDDTDAPANPFAALPFGRPNTWHASLQLTQPLYTGGRVGTALQIARRVRTAADLQMAESEAEIVLQVRAAYFRIVLTDQLVDITRESYRLADAHLSQVELFRQQGTAAEFDVLRARVERDNLEPNIVDAVHARRLAELSLKRLINMPADQPIDPVTPLEPVIAAVDRGALVAALARRPALRALDEQVAIREGVVRIVRADRLPTVGMAANFASQAFPDQVFPLDATWRRDWTVTVQASVPVFDGFRTRGAIAEARTEVRLAELQRDQARQAMELELEAALGEFDGARAQIEARRATVMHAERALELAELRFTSGLATQLELSNARLLLQQARVNEAQALFNYVNALARLERLSGGSVPLVDPRVPPRD